MPSVENRTAAEIGGDVEQTAWRQALPGQALVLGIALGSLIGAYCWLSAQSPGVGSGGPTALAVNRPAPAAPSRIAAPALPTRVLPEQTETQVAEAAPKAPPSDAGAVRAAPAASALPAPSRIHSSETVLAPGRKAAPQASNRVAYVLHHADAASREHEAERRLLDLVAALPATDSFSVFATAGGGAVFAAAPVAAAPGAVAELRAWLDRLPNSPGAALEASVTSALAVPAVSRVVVVVDFAPEAAQQAWMLLDRVVREGNPGGAAVSTISVTPRSAVPAVLPGRTSGSPAPRGSDEIPLQAVQAGPELSR